MTLAQIRELLTADLIIEHDTPRLDIKFAKASDLMSDVLAFSQPFTERDTILITGLTNNQVVRTCEIAGVGVIVFVRGKNPPAETIELARQCNITLLATRLKMFDACGILYAHGIVGVKTEACGRPRDGA